MLLSLRYIQLPDPAPLSAPHCKKIGFLKGLGNALKSRRQIDQLNDYKATAHIEFQSCALTKIPSDRMAY